MIASADALFQDSLTTADVQQVRVLMAILIASMAITFPNIIFDCYITAHERYIFQRIMLIIVTILIPVISLPLLYMGVSFDSIGVCQSDIICVAIWYEYLLLSYKITYEIPISWLGNWCFKKCRNIFYVYIFE